MPAPQGRLLTVLLAAERQFFSWYKSEALFAMAPQPVSPVHPGAPALESLKGPGTGTLTSWPGDSDAP